MAIFRGTGGAGDSTTDATVTEVTQQAVNAAASALAASSSATLAANSATSASDSATASASSATDAETAQTAAETAQLAAEGARDTAVTAQGLAEDAQSYAEEWAVKAEDSLISTDAGGDGSTDYSALHHAAKASASATAASNSASAASDSETAAETSEGNAADFASDAQKLAINVEDSQYTLSDGTTTGYSALHYNAKASASATAASDSETNAATSESNASDSASDASKLAITAYNTQYTLADGTTTGYSALHYATVAENAVESIQATYLGPQASNPTLDLNGDAVTAGDWYFNTGDNTTRIYDGANWNTFNPDLVGDTTPQLGGDLDLNSNDITGTGNIDITGNAVYQTAINAQTGTTYTTVLDDASKLITMNNGSATTVTIPPNSSVAYPVGTKIDFVQIGGGRVTFAGGSGVTVNSTPTLKTRARYSAVSCIKISTDGWILVGDLAES